ncbi:ABC transporter permease [Solihabitans fulvus]|uniref:ABC transporter permease n=1 Tax=Solihabitans fulvus TaxID=1892852 RepID=A0A5B2XIZ7_9PSEU|nr:ABC transporter permease [Solihabitans fulvus]KAA2262995.1 ABC transporter permease [Solihabitans fulvus]
MSSQGTSTHPARPVLLVARREFLNKVRSRSFVIGTVVIIAFLAGYVLLQTFLFDKSTTSTVGLTGQATVVAEQLKATAKAAGRTIDIKDVADPAAGEDQVRKGDLDALVTGASGALRVVVKNNLDDTLHSILDTVAQQQVLGGQLAEAGLDPRKVEQNMAQARPKVTMLEPKDEQHGERLAVGLIVAGLLYYSLLVYGMMVAQGVVEEKSSRVVEIMLATIRPWQLLLGKVIGLGAVGLLQLLIIGAGGIGLAVSTNVLDTTSLAGGALAAGVLWYLLGFFLYATIFAAVASLVSRQEDLQSVVTPITMAIVVAFVVGINLMIQDASGTAVTVLSMLPPFAPVLMPGRMALGVAPAWEVLLAVALALASIAAITWFGGRVYRNAVLRTGARVKLREVLR